MAEEKKTTESKKAATGDKKPVRTFLSHGFKGRGGKGPVTVNSSLVLPNGDIAEPGDTFDPVEEKMTAGKFARIVQMQYVTPSNEEVLTKLMTTLSGKK